MINSRFNHLGPLPGNIQKQLEKRYKLTSFPSKLFARVLATHPKRVRIVDSKKKEDGIRYKVFIAWQSMVNFERERES